MNNNNNNNNNDKYYYISTASHPTCTTHALVGSFTSSDSIDLVIGKSNRLEIHTSQKEGLSLVCDPIPLNGRLLLMQLFRPALAHKDYLLVMTVRYDFFVLSLVDNAIQTLVTGSLKYDMGEVSDRKLAYVDPYCRYFVAHLYDGIIQITPFDGNGLLNREAYNIRVNELNILDICLTYSNPSQLVILYQDAKEVQYLKYYNIHLNERKLQERGTAISLDHGSNQLISCKQGGIIVISKKSITYYHGDNVQSISIQVTNFNLCSGKIDDNRILLSDDKGYLYILILMVKTINDRIEVNQLHIERLGLCSPASAICYLDNGVTYIGSSASDSLLIKLLDIPNPDNHGYLFELLEEIENIGPIQDMTVVDMQREGQGQIITCSGTGNHGSLRIIRNGIAINEEASVDMEGIKGLWSLSSSNNEIYHKYLVQSFVSETRILAIEGEALDEIEECGFETLEQTLYCNNMKNNVIIQVTSSMIKLISCNTLETITIWKPAENRRITTVTSNDEHIILSTGGGHLLLLSINYNDYSIKNVSHIIMKNEIACIDIRNDNLIAVGLWKTFSISLLTIKPQLNIIYNEKLTHVTVPRSLKFVNFNTNISYLLCGLGDGHLIIYTISNDKELKNEKTITLGSEPIILSTFKQYFNMDHVEPSNNNNHNIGISSASSLIADDSGSEHDVEMKDINDNNVQMLEYVFACCDRPTVIYINPRQHDKLLFSNVNKKDVRHMAYFNAEVFPDSLAFSSSSSLIIGNIDDEIQRLHVQKINLNSHPRRICHQISSNTFLIGTIHTNMNNDGVDEHYIYLMNDQTFDHLDKMKLDLNENICSMISFDELSLYVIGTAYVLPEQPEPTQGRILIAKIVNQKINIISSSMVDGAVYSSHVINNDRLVVGINSIVCIYKFDNNFNLIKECQHFGHVVVIDIKVKGEYIIVGDLLKSVVLLLYKPQTSTIEELARDYNPNWITAVDILDNDTYISAETNSNIFITSRNKNTLNEEERSRLNVVASYHTGDFINVFRHGSLVMNTYINDNQQQYQSILAGTVCGSILSIITLNKEQYAFLNSFEKIMEEVSFSLGELNHKQWRAFTNDSRQESSSVGFIDGDLIESFLGLKLEDQQDIAKRLNMDISVVCNRIEEVSRLHQ